MHGNLGIGFLALLGFYGSAVGGMYLGSELDGSSNPDGFFDSSALLGFLIGAIGWVIFDANVLAVESTVEPRSRLLHPFNSAVFKPRS